MANQIIPDTGAKQNSEVDTHLDVIRKRVFEMAAAAKAVWSLIGDRDLSSEESAASVLLELIEDHAGTVAETAESIGMAIKQSSKVSEVAHV